MLDHAATAFDRWNGLIAARLVADGIPAKRAKELAVLTTAAPEGGIVLARAARGHRAPRRRPPSVARPASRPARKGAPPRPRSAAHRLHPCECNCGIVVQTEGRHLAKICGDKDHLASQGYTCNKALRPTTTRTPSGPADVAAAPRADGSMRRSTGTPRSPRSRRGLQRVAEDHGGDKIFYYGGGGQGTTSAAATAAPSSGPLGSRYRSNALAQEKTGEWVDAHFYGGHTCGEFEHAEVSVFVGKNPWMSQSFPRARQCFNEIAKDPGRSMIVIDPVVTDTAKMADFHLRVAPAPTPGA